MQTKLKVMSKRDPRLYSEVLYSVVRIRVVVCGRLIFTPISHQTPLIDERKLLYFIHSRHLSISTGGHKIQIHCSRATSIPSRPMDKRVTDRSIIFHVKILKINLSTHDNSTQYSDIVSIINQT